MRKNEVFTILISVALLLSSIFPLSVPDEVRADLTDPSSLTNHSPILIDGDANFTLSNGVVAGSGTPNDPYIIENWSISAFDDHGISIKNTNVHFVIRNSYIFSGSLWRWQGIYFGNVTNGIAENNRIDDDCHGIYVYRSTGVIVRNNTVYESWASGIDIRDSSNITVNNNTVYDTTDPGIKVLRSDDNFINDNIVYNNTEGIDIDRSNNNTVNGNEVFNSTWDGIVLSGANNNTVYGNIVHDNFWDGIAVDGSNNNTVHSNTIYNNTKGLMVEGSDYNTIVDNMIFDNDHGLLLERSSWNTLYDNTMNGNVYNFGLFEQYILSNYNYDNTVPINNTVDGKPIYYWVSQSQRTVPSDAGYVALIECDNITVKDLSLSYNLQGILVANSTDVMVEGNTISEVSIGIQFSGANGDIVSNDVHDSTSATWIEYSDLGTISDNDFQNIWYGFFLWTNKIESISDNKIVNASPAMYIIDLVGCEISRNTIQGSISESLISYSTDITFSENTIINSTYGFEIYEVEGVSITNNTMHDIVEDGFALKYVSNGRIEDNEIFNIGGSGIYFQYTTKNNTVSRNIIYKAQYGIGTLYRNGLANIDNIFTNNTLFDNGYGFFLGAGTNGTIKDNMVFDNNIGIYTAYTNDNLIYNNYFHNTRNYKELANNYDTWNISKTQGTNIVGGPFLGGNYWSDYSGTDINDDLLGDTKIPYKYIDNLPLLRTSINDTTTGGPTTGDPFAINASVRYLVGSNNVTVHYQFDNGSMTNQTSVLVTSDGSLANFSINITVPSNVTKLNYSMTLNNTVDGLHHTDLRTLNVTDNDEPMVTDLSGDPVTGEGFVFNFDFHDNMNVSNATLEYWFDGGQATSTHFMNLTNLTNISMSIDVPIDARVLHYNLSVLDNSNNTRSLSISKEVIDNIVPEVVDLTEGPAMTGYYIMISCNVTDNRDIENVSVVYETDNDEGGGPMTLEGDRYIFNLTVPTDATELRYSIKAQDSSGNTMTLEMFFLVIDVIAPIISDDTETPTTGEWFYIRATSTDNIGVNRSLLDYWFDNGTVTRINFIDDHRIKVPSNARVLNYRIRCVDTSDNWANISRGVQVIDNDNPSLEDLTQGRAKAGENYLIEVAVTDNVEVQSVIVTYWTDGRSKERQLVLDSDRYSAMVKVPEDADKLHYTIHVKDTAGNDFTSSEKVVIVEQANDAYINDWAIGILLAICVVFVLTLLILRNKKKRHALKESEWDKDEWDKEEEDLGEE